MANINTVCDKQQYYDKNNNTDYESVILVMAINNTDCDKQ